MKIVARLAIVTEQAELQRPSVYPEQQTFVTQIYENESKSALSFKLYKIIFETQ